MAIKLQQFNTITSIFGLMTLHGALSATQFYYDLDFNGLLYEHDATEDCTNLSKWAQNLASSIKTEDCIIVHDSPNCGGNSYKMDPGEYPNLRKVAHVDGQFFQDSIISFRKCSDVYGGPQTRVTFYTEGNSNGEIILDYHNIKGNINIPVAFFDEINSFDNHGNCVKFKLHSSASAWNGEIVVQGGISHFSRSPKDFGDILFMAVRPCDLYTFNSTVVSFTVSEDKSGGQIKQTALSMGTTTTFINDGLATVSQEYGASKTITEFSEITLVNSISVLSSWSVKAGVEVEYSSKIPYVAHASAKASLSTAYSLQKNASSTTTKSVRHEESTVYSVNQKIEIEPCTRYKVGSSVKMAKGFPMIYAIEFEVTGMDGNRKLNTSEIRGKLGSLHFVGDKDNYTVIASDEGKMVMDFGMESEISGSGEIIEGCRNNTKKVGERFERVGGYRYVKLDVVETMLIVVVFNVIVLVFKGFKICKFKRQTHLEGYEKL